MSRRIFKDVEEAIAREIRRITFDDTRTADRIILEDVFDPFTGDIKQVPIEPSFYDSSADANHIQYPHFFIRLLRTGEDLTTGRIISPFSTKCLEYVESAPKAYYIVTGDNDGSITAPTSDMETSIFQIRKIQSGFLLRLLTGNNRGTYIIDSITTSGNGPHTITVSDILVNNLPIGLFSLSDRILVFTETVDLNTAKVGDIFEDSLAATFSIDEIDIDNNSIKLGGVGSPDLSAGGSIKRSGNVFQNTEISTVKFIVMDPSQPIIYNGVPKSTATTETSPSVPIDIYYLVRIDSKERENHIDVLNRMWEEFNPPRTGIPIIVRGELSAEQKLSEDIATGGSTTVKVADNSKFGLNDPIFIFDDLGPTKSSSGGFSEPFESTVVQKISSDTLVLSNTVPDTYTVDNNAKIVSNANFKVFMFHFVNHVTRDLEGAQYWIHEFTFWVQVWVDRLEEQEIRSVIQDIATPIEDINGNVIIDDQ